MNKGIYIVCIILSFMQCTSEKPRTEPKEKVQKLSEIEYQLKPFTYELVNTNTGTDAIEITSDGTVWVDRVEIPNYLESDSLCDRLVKCDWRYILIEVKGNRVDFINKIAPELKRIAASL